MKLSFLFLFHLNFLAVFIKFQSRVDLNKILAIGIPKPNKPMLLNKILQSKFHLPTP
ncbi:hypothetical protein ACB098_02G107500 [Castanea mollissima]